MLFNRKLLAQYRDYASQFSFDAKQVKIFEDGAMILQDILDILSVTPSDILELGARHGIFTRILSQYYPAARLSICDISTKMLELNPNENKFQLDEDIELNIIQDKFDLIGSNLNLHFINDLPMFLSKVKSILNKNGVFIATCFAESSLHNFRKSFIEVESIIGYKHYNRMIPFLRASDLSQLLLGVGFNNIVVDINKYTIENTSMLEIAKYIKNMGEGNIRLEKSDWTISKALYPHLNRRISDLYFIVTIMAYN